MQLKSWFTGVPAVALGLLVMPRAGAQETQGWVSAVWKVAPDPRVPVTTSLLFADDAGNSTPLVIDEAALRAIGGIMAIDRRRVAISGVTQVGPLGVRGGATSVLSATSIRLLEAAPRAGLYALASPPQSGSKPYVTILCRFADSLSVAPKPVEYYRSLLTGTASPFLDNYWRETSENRINLGGSEVFGWYNLALPKSAYFPSGNPAQPDWEKMVADCTGLADPEVDFSKYFGVNLQFDLRMDFSWGGSAILSRDGPPRISPMTWMSSWAVQQSYAHEMGHSFGLPHSSGSYQETYDSRWDPMSSGGKVVGNEYVAVHTISFHKDLLGWIPVSQKYRPLPGSNQTITIQRLATPPSPTDYVMAQVPISGTNTFYTVEARKFAGYDTGLPGEAIIIHKVNPALSDRAAQVVDSDNNGNPNDAGAMWVPGEIFVDEPNEISIQVVSSSATSYQVAIRAGAEPVVIGSSPIKTAAIGLPYADTLRATGGIGVFTWSVTAGALPPGIALASSTGVLSGIPSSTGSFAFTVTATSGSRSSSVAKVGDVYQPVAIEGDSIRRTGVPTQSYADTLKATGGSRSYTWSVTEGVLPAGLRIDSNSGVISGVPATSGLTSFTVTASSTSLTAARRFTLPVEALLQLSSDALRQGFMGAAYKDTLLATGGTGAWTWSVSSGTLPPGLSIEAATGALSGITTAAGAFPFQATVRSGTQSQSKNFTITIAKPTLQAQQVLDHYLGVGALTDDQVRFLDLLGNRNGRLDVGDIRAWLLDSGQITASLSAELKELIKQDTSVGGEKR